MDCSTPGFPVHHQLLELAQTQVQQVSDAIQPSHPLSSPSPPAFNLSQHQDLFQTVLVLRWPKYWNFSFGISPSNEYSGLISFKIDLLDLLAVQGTLETPLQHHSSKASILQRSAFFIVQLLHTFLKNNNSFSPQALPFMAIRLYSTRNPTYLGIWHELSLSTILIPLLTNLELFLKLKYLLENGCSISGLSQTGIFRIWFSSASLHSPGAPYRRQVGALST